MGDNSSDTGGVFGNNSNFGEAIEHGDRSGDDSKDEFKDPKRSLLFEIFLVLCVFLSSSSKLAWF